MICLIMSAVVDVVALYSFALPVFIAASAAFLAGLALGICLILRFCEVTKHGGTHGTTH